VQRLVKIGMPTNRLSIKILERQCFDTVGWVTGTASSLKMMGGDDLTGALHIL